MGTAAAKLNLRYGPAEFRDLSGHPPLLVSLSHYLLLSSFIVLFFFLNLNVQYNLVMPISENFQLQQLKLPEIGASLNVLGMN